MPSMVGQLAASDIATLLREFGRFFYIEKTTPGTYNDETAKTDPNATDKTRYKGFLLDYSDYLVNGVTIMTGDRRLLVQAKGVEDREPVEGDVAIFPQNERYAIINVKRFEIRDQTIAWSLQVRK